MIDKLCKLRPDAAGRCYRVCIAAAADAESLAAAAELYRQGLAEATLVGDRAELEALLAAADFPYQPRLVQAADDQEAALLAASLVRGGEADVLMKGRVNSSSFLQAVLDKERGIRGPSLLSHLMAFALPGAEKLIFHSDGGMNLFPDLAAKKAIIENAVRALRAIGVERPKVAVLTANERVSAKMPATEDAAALRRLWEQGWLPECLLEGPITMDVALSREAAAHKGIASEISGEVDLFIVPNIEAGNLVGKTLRYTAQARMAGVILGATRPVVMTSRAEGMQGKIDSLVLACACLS